MYFKPHRFRFGLMALFAVIAAVGVLVSLWNPFPKPSRTNVDKIELGMTEDDVAELIGQPDRVVTNNEDGRVAYVYDLGNGEAWLVVFEDGRVMRNVEAFSYDAIPKTQ
jgi:hypothetical protein